MAGPRGEDAGYTPPYLARFFHAFPHLNISLHFVNSTFDPESDIYLESLGILGSLPAAWLILTLLVLLIYLLTRCCDRKPRPRHSIIALKWTLAAFTLLCCTAVGFDLYGNDDVHNAMVQFIAAARSIDDIITGVKNQTSSIEYTLTHQVDPHLTELSDVFDNPVANQTARGLLLAALLNAQRNMSTVLTSTQDINRNLQEVSMRNTIDLVQTAETIRWPLTMAILSILLVFCVVLLFGVACHSRCALITFSVFGLFAVIISWLMASLYLATSVALGDLCVAPEGFLEREAVSPVKVEILTYYVRCEPQNTNPFTQHIIQGQRSVKHMITAINQVAKMAKELYSPSELNSKLDILTTSISSVDRLVSGLATLLDCKPLYKQYLNAVRNVCDLGLYGLSFMLIASLAAGFFFTVLVWVDSHTWIYIRKRRDYLQVDEHDPFLPPTAASQAIAARTLRSQGSYGSTGRFRTRYSPSYQTPTSTPPYLRDLDGRSTREEKSQHSSHHESAGIGSHESGTGGPTMLGPNHGQYATLSKQCKTLESSDFY